MMFKPTLRALCGVMAALLAGITFAASAQFVQPHRQPPAVPKSSDPLATPPAGLKWQWMGRFDFNTTNMHDSGKPEEKSLVSKIWSKEINNAIDPSTHAVYYSYAVMGSVEHDGTRVILTMFDSLYSDCIPPGSGKGMYDMYFTCPFRLIHISPDGQATEQNFPANFCLLDLDNDSNNPREKNHTEYAFDKRTGIVYLRIIQYGKVVADCNRALRIFKVN